MKFLCRQSFSSVLKKYALCVLALVCWVGNKANAQDVSGLISENDKPKNIKLIREYVDKNGTTVREVQYTQGMARVTETIFIPRSQITGIFRPIRPDTLVRDSLMILVDKSHYSVKLYYKRRMIRSYKAVFGPRPLQNKCMEGDRCTPEGWFKIAAKNPRSKYNKFMLISYPNDSTQMRFNQLKASGIIPSTARIGGDIGIHGIWPGGDDMIEMGIGWTDGCVALKNKDIEELFTFVGVGTRVFIKR